jgi:hypothetical protein
VLALAAMVPAVSAGNTRKVFVGSATDGVLTSSSVSGGESTSFVVTVKNMGGQNLNHVVTYIGKDDNPASESNPQTAITPTKPVAFPAGTSATAAGCTGGDGAVLTCDLGSLGKGKSWTTTVILSSTSGVTAQVLDTKVTSFVAETANDNGSNKDTFAAEGTITLLPFSCDSVTAYRATGPRTVSTPCAVAGTNKQQSSVVLPGALTTITLSEGAAIVACPVVSGLKCIGDAVDASIDGDSTADVVKWTVVYNVSGVSVNLNKLRVYHYNDAGQITPAGGFPLKNNACKNAGSINCGTATLSGGILTIVFQTAGNGKTRLLG